jgi:uncharacterized OB-fold protein
VNDLVVWRCEHCGERSFPRRELCPNCTSDIQAAEPQAIGVVTGITNHRGTSIGCVDAEGTRIIVRLVGDLAVGETARLGIIDNAPVACPRGHRPRTGERGVRFPFQLP